MSAPTKQEIIDAKAAQNLGVTIPQPKVFAVLFDWTNKADAAAQTNQGAKILDLTGGIANYHQGLLRFECAMQNKSATPSGVSSVTLKYAFFSTNPYDRASTPILDAALDVAPFTSVPTVFAPGATSVAFTFPNVAALDVTGALFKGSANVKVEGRYLAFWYDVTGVAAGGSVDWKITAVAI